MGMEKTNNFSRALLFIALWEWGNRKDGGYTNHPNDPGGETRWGCSKKAYPNVDIRNLSFEKAAEFYAKDYWDASGCDSIPFPDCVAVFDTAVNCGVGRTKGWLKSSEGINDFLTKRVDHYTLLARNNPSLKVFLNGWINRVNDVKKYLTIHASDD
jgi:lysozyme family protein